MAGHNFASLGESCHTHGMQSGLCTGPWTVAEEERRPQGAGAGKEARLGWSYLTAHRCAPKTKACYSSKQGKQKP